MPGVSNAFLLAAHIACAAAFGAPYAPRLPGTFSGAAPNLRSLPALADLTALSRAENAPAALSSLAVEHSRVSRRQLCVWGVVIASALTGCPHSGAARAGGGRDDAVDAATGVVPGEVDGAIGRVRKGGSRVCRGVHRSLGHRPSPPIEYRRTSLIRNRPPPRTLQQS
ncbi:hypothetical protein T484DRAFT_3445010 [Baffinella frigidus]|nr:hypothetical protein T484DRAFT_3445010 [Cryptophyta sp. CCMP2293]